MLPASKDRRGGGELTHLLKENVRTAVVVAAALDEIVYDVRRLPGKYLYRVEVGPRDVGGQVDGNAIVVKLSKTYKVARVASEGDGPTIIVVGEDREI